MKPTTSPMLRSILVTLFGVLCVGPQFVHAEGNPWLLRTRPTGQGMELSWHGLHQQTDGSVVRPQWKAEGVKSQHSTFWLAFSLLV